MERLKKVPYFASLVLLAYMPFHIFLSQWLSTFTGHLDAWKIGKDIGLCVITLFTICLVWQQRRGDRVFNWLVGFGLGYGLLHLLLWAAHPTIYSRSAELGVIYNVRLPLFLILGYGAVRLYPHINRRSVSKLLISVSTVVATFGVAQYFLPGDFLSHFGYSIARGAWPVFYVDGNPTLPVRIMSTLREPNALGAYLLVPTLLLGYMVAQAAVARKRLLYSALLLLHIVAITLTLSRSAWLGIIMAGAAICIVRYGKAMKPVLARFWPLAVALCLLVVVTGFSLRNTSVFQSYITHSGEGQPDDPNSDGYHIIFVKRGLEGIKDQPLGHGPGTAGLASIQNPHGSFLTENYYIQIGYELGIVGLALFVALNIWLYHRLLRAPRDALGLALLGSFWAYVVTNMLLHTWGNEAVAAQWWTLAGIISCRQTTAPIDKPEARSTELNAKVAA